MLCLNDITDSPTQMYSQIHNLFFILCSGGVPQWQEEMAYFVSSVSLTSPRKAGCRTATEMIGLPHIYPTELPTIHSR